MKVSSIFALLLITLCSLSSCKKDDEQAPQTKETKPACRINKSYNAVNLRDSVVYQYGQGGELLKRTLYDAGKEKSTVSYEYNGQGQLAKATNKDMFLYSSVGPQFVEVIDVSTFAYNSTGQVAGYTAIRTTQSQIYARPPLQVTYQYDNEGNRTKITKTLLGSTTNTATAEFVYNNGNCIKAIHETGGYSSVVIEYEHYLDKENKDKPVFESVSQMEHTPNKNMVKRAIHIYPNNSSNFTTHSSYEYNDKGYRTKTFVELVQGNNTSTGTFITEYDCN
jgi:hypothetical protein